MAYYGEKRVIRFGVFGVSVDLRPSYRKVISYDQILAKRYANSRHKTARVPPPYFGFTFGRHGLGRKYITHDA